MCSTPPDRSTAPIRSPPSGKAKKDPQQGVSINGSAADDALRELCEGTCDADADCDADMDGSEMICDLSAVPYGRCVRRVKYNRDVMLPLSITVSGDGRCSWCSVERLCIT